jgi:transglutaminase-like putative cysteine protease
VGSQATHAWVEVLAPGHVWAALDPTNNRWCGEQHVGVSFGRDASDAAPIRGTFKGAGSQSMKVHVKMRRLRGAANLKKSPTEPDGNSTDRSQAGEATKA